MSVEASRRHGDGGACAKGFHCWEASQREPRRHRAQHEPRAKPMRLGSQRKGRRPRLELHALAAASERCGLERQRRRDGLRQEGNVRRRVEDGGARQAHRQAYRALCAIIVRAGGYAGLLVARTAGAERDRPRRKASRARVGVRVGVHARKCQHRLHRGGEQRKNPEGRATSEDPHSLSGRGAHNSAGNGANGRRPSALARR